MLDAYDLKLLRRLQHNSGLTFDELGEAVALSPSACRRRVAAMRKAGIIRKQVALVDPSSVGFAILVIALVVLERDTREHHRAFHAAIAEHPEVTSCLFVTGSTDYVLEVHSRSLSDYHALADNLFVENPTVRRFESLIVMRSVRRETALPV